MGNTFSPPEPVITLEMDSKSDAGESDSSIEANSPREQEKLILEDETVPTNNETASGEETKRRGESTTNKKAAVKKTEAAKKAEPDRRCTNSSYSAPQRKSQRDRTPARYLFDPGTPFLTDNTQAKREEKSLPQNKIADHKLSETAPNDERNTTKETPPVTSETKKIDPTKERTSPSSLAEESLSVSASKSTNIKPKCTGVVAGFCPIRKSERARKKVTRLVDTLDYALPEPLPGPLKVAYGKRVNCKTNCKKDSAMSEKIVPTGGDGIAGATLVLQSVVDTLIARVVVDGDQSPVLEGREFGKKKKVIRSKHRLSVTTTKRVSGTDSARTASDFPGKDRHQSESLFTQGPLLMQGSALKSHLYPPLLRSKKDRGNSTTSVCGGATAVGTISNITSVAAVPVTPEQSLSGKKTSSSPPSSHSDPKEGHEKNHHPAYPPRIEMRNLLLKYYHKSTYVKKAWLSEIDSKSPSAVSRMFHRSFEPYEFFYCHRGKIWKSKSEENLSTSLSKQRRESEPKHITSNEVDAMNGVRSRPRAAINTENAFDATVGVHADGIVLASGQDNTNRSIHNPWPARVTSAREAQLHRRGLKSEGITVDPDRVCVIYFFPCWGATSYEMDPTKTVSALDRWYQMDFVHKSSLHPFSDKGHDLEGAPEHVKSRFMKGLTIATGLKQWAQKVDLQSPKQKYQCKYRCVNKLQHCVGDYGDVLLIPDVEWVKNCDTLEPDKIVTMIEKSLAKTKDGELNGKRSASGREDEVTRDLSSAGSKKKPRTHDYRMSPPKPCPENLHNLMSPTAESSGQNTLDDVPCHGNVDRSPPASSLLFDAETMLESLTTVLSGVGGKFAAETSCPKSRAVFDALANINAGGDVNINALPTIVGGLCTRIVQLERAASDATGEKKIDAN